MKCRLCGLLRLFFIEWDSGVCYFLKSYVDYGEMLCFVMVKSGVVGQGTTF